MSGIFGVVSKNKKDVFRYIGDKTSKYDKMISQIAKDLGATTLKYQKIADMVSAIGLPKDKLCLYCWTGKF